MLIRLLSFLTVALFAVDSTFAQVRFDTLSSRPIGPGMTHTYIVEPTTPWNINVVEVDLTNPYVRMQSMKAFDRVGARETVGSMVERHDREGHRVVAAINGDFYTTSWPVAMQVVDGEMVVGAVRNRPGVSFSSDNRVRVEVPLFTGTITTSNGDLSIDGVNRARGTEEVVFYNRFRGSTTGTTSDGREVIVSAVDEWIVNEPVRVVVESIATAGNNSIPSGGAILSGQGSAGDALFAAVSTGDTLEVYLEGRPAAENITQMISGGPFIVKEGQVDVGPRGDGVDRHPRTAAGINADSTRFYMVTVDGRQSASAGMTLAELADFMVRIGIDRAMNLDGGGSTTLIIHGEVENLLLGDQRAVANGLAVVSAAPFGEIAAVRARQQSLRIFQGHEFRFAVDGVDEYNHPVDFDPDQVEFSVDDHLGTVAQDGTFTAGSERGEGHLYITYGEFIDTVNVVVTDIAELEIRPSGILIDTTRTFAFSFRAYDDDGRRQYPAAGEVTWSVVDEDMGTVDETGRFRGLQAGVTGVVAHYKSVTDTARVEIEIVEGIAQLSDFETMDGWSVELQNLDSDGSSVSIVELEDGTNAMQVDYRFTQGTASVFRMYIRQEIEVQGVPEFVHLDVKSDGLNHRVFFELEDAEGGRLTAFVPKFINETEFDSLAAPAWWQGMVHPMKVRGMGIQFGNTGVAGAVNEGTLLLKNLRVSYPERLAVSVDDPMEIPGEIALEQNYPNPFNPSTTIRYSLSQPGPVSVRIYDALGRLVETLVDRSGVAPGTYDVTWNTEAGGRAIPSGVYFYVLEANGQRLSRSMVLLK
jgi:hypothetical protein